MFGKKKDDSGSKKSGSGKKKVVVKRPDVAPHTRHNLVDGRQRRGSSKEPLMQEKCCTDCPYTKWVEI